MRNLTTEQKLKIIEQSASMKDLPHFVLPATHKEDYYFVSYSHQDYKLVLKDILLLEERGINIWYDNEIHVGENWQEIAQLYISKFQCRGIIFYLTENSIKSTACNEEVEYVLEHNKPYFSVNMPLDGQDAASGLSMLDELQRRGFRAPANLRENFEKAFYDEKIFLSYDADIESKAHQIKSIKYEDLLEVESSLTDMTLLSCRDNSILSVDLTKKYVCDDVDDEFEDDVEDAFKDLYLKKDVAAEETISAIADCVFTNCFKLRNVLMPPTLTKIGANAFRNCHDLKEIDLSHVLAIGESAFRDCKNLQNVDLSCVGKIGSMAFCGCKSLKTDKISGSIGAFAFSGVHTEKLTYVEEFPSFAPRALEGILDLREVEITGKFVNGLQHHTFANNHFEKIGPFFVATEEEIPEEITLGYTAEYEKAHNVPVEGLPVGAYVFSHCQNLKEITFGVGWNFSQAEGAFEKCSSLVTLNLQGANPVLPDNFAKECEKLSNVTCDKTVRVIGDYAFFQCSSLENFDFSSAEDIGESAFARSGLKEITLPKVKRIRETAFANCRHLTCVTICSPKVVIESAAFKDCDSLNVVKILSEEAYPETDALPQSVKVIYLNSPDFAEILKSENLQNLRVVYVGSHVKFENFPLADFEETPSDEEGFRKFVCSHDDFDYAAENADFQSAAFNRPLNGEKYKTDLSLEKFFLGHEVLLKHFRAREMRVYFVEQVVHAEDSPFVVDKLLVSAHCGKRFGLDGTLIEDMLLWDANTAFMSSFRNDKDEVIETYRAESIAVDPEKLKWKHCVVSCLGEVFEGECQTVALLYKNNRPVADETGNADRQKTENAEKFNANVTIDKIDVNTANATSKAPLFVMKNLILNCSGEKHAFCGRDIDEITAFDEYFFSTVFKNKHKK